MGIGAAWALGGLAVTAATYSAASGGGTYLVASGAIVFGGLQFFIGLSQVLSAESDGPEAQEQLCAEASVRVVLNSMLAMAASDGAVGEKEISSIATIYQQVFQIDLPADWIRENAEEMQQDGFDIFEVLASDRDQIHYNTHALVLKTSCSVAAADGVIRNSELETLNMIASALGMDENEVKSAVMQLQGEPDDLSSV